MRRMVTVIPVLALLAWAGGSHAADTVAKPDCSAKQKAYDEAKSAAKPVKADLSTCKDKKGKEKGDCEKPFKDKATQDHKAAMDRAKADKRELDCCKNPKMAGCSA